MHTFCVCVCGVCFCNFIFRSLFSLRCGCCCCCRCCLNAFMLRIRTQLLVHHHRRRRRRHRSRCCCCWLSLLPFRTLLSNQNPFRQTYWMNNGVKGLLFPEEKYSNNFKWLTLNLYSSTFAAAASAAEGGGGDVWCCCSSLPHTICFRL